VTWEIRQGDCIERMAEMEEASIDAVVCDPPYGLEFMGKDWDRPDRMGKISDLGVADGTPFRSNAGTPSWAGSGNPACLNCGGTKYDRTRPNGCKCDAPDFPAEAVPQMRALQAWCEDWAREALRVLRPGGHLLAFGGTRTYHRLTAGIEDAGFEIRDSIMWLYGSGFPKSLDVLKAIDKSACTCSYDALLNAEEARAQITSCPVHGDDAKPTGAAQWGGWGTALKPAHEPIVVARKPLIGTVAANVLEHGTGGINVGGCRIGTGDGGDRHGEESAERRYTENGSSNFAPMPGPRGGDAGGRWPANVVLDEEAAAELDAQTGILTSGSGPLRRRADKFGRNVFGDFKGTDEVLPSGNSGGASRFFYCAKTSRAERNAGLEGFEERTAGMRNNVGRPLSGTEFDPKAANHHPTVKPINLMRWLVRLITPPGGLVLDPFLGSGTTGCAAVLEGFDFIGLEREAEYIEIAEARIAFWAEHQGREVEDILGLAARAIRETKAHKDGGQLELEAVA
jgi:DNA modification methylase